MYFRLGTMNLGSRQHFVNDEVCAGTEGQSQCSSVACVFRYPSFVNMGSEPNEIHATLNFPNIAGSQSLLFRRVILYVRALEPAKSCRSSLSVAGHVSWKGDTSGRPRF